MKNNANQRSNPGGKVHAYVGDGKGKTSAACGLIMRCAGYGYQVTMVQFLKGQLSGEELCAGQIDNIDIRHFGSEQFYIPGKSDILEFRQYCRTGLDYAAKAISSSVLLVLDEILDAVDLGLISEEELLDLLAARKKCEVVLTGRKVPNSINDQCDLITEMNKIKHYFDTGLTARKGIEY